MAHLVRAKGTVAKDGPHRKPEAMGLAREQHYDLVRAKVVEAWLCHSRCTLQGTRAAPGALFNKRGGVAEMGVSSIRLCAEKSLRYATPAAPFETCGPILVQVAVEGWRRGGSVSI